MPKWEKLFGGIPLKQISFELGQPIHIAAHWGVNSSNEVWRLAGSGWQHVARALKFVSIGISPDGDFAPVWGVNRVNQIFRWQGGENTGDDWELIPGNLKQVSVGTSGVWGVDGTNKVFRWNGDQRTGSGCFDLIGGTRKMVASGKNSVWGLNAQNQIFRWNGGAGTGNTWTHIAGSLVQIDVGNVACGVNSQGQVLRWNGTGNTWQKLGTKSNFKYVSIAEHGVIFAISTLDEIWHWRTDL